MWKSCHFFCLQSKLKNCEKCLCVAYCSTKCSEEDKKDHEKSCFWLKTILQDYLASHRTQHDLARKWKPRPYLISRDLPISIQVFFQQELQNFCRDAEIKKLDLRLLELLPIHPLKTSAYHGFLPLPPPVGKFGQFCPLPAKKCHCLKCKAALDSDAHDM